MDIVSTERSPRRRESRSLLTRKRFQFAGALLPWSLRGPFLPGSMTEAASLNALTGNVGPSLSLSGLACRSKPIPASAAAMSSFRRH
jgi:hypothetical protein